MENGGKNTDRKMQAARGLELEIAGKIAGENVTMEIEGKSTHWKMQALENEGIGNCRHWKMQAPEYEGNVFISCGTSGGLTL